MNEKIKFLGRKKVWWFVISVAIMIPGIIALILWRLPFGIDFKGGTELQIKTEKSTTENQLRQKLTDLEQVRGLSLSASEDDSYLIRILPIDEEEHRQIIDELGKDFGTITEVQYQSVGPSVSADLTKKAVIAVGLAA